MLQVIEPLLIFGLDNFYTGEEAVEETVKIGTGGIDPSERRKRIGLPVKPTGLIERPVKEGRKDVEDRAAETAGIAAEIAGKLAREFGEETQQAEAQKRIEQMTLAEVDFEIGVLLRKKLRTEEDEIMILLLIAASVA